MKSKNYRFVKVAYFSADNLEENKSNEHNRFFKRTEKMDSKQVQVVEGLSF